LRDPEFGILALDIIYEQRTPQCEHRHEKQHRKVVPPQRPDMRIDARNQSRCACGRVCGFGQVHDDEGNGGREGGG
jgi:hypothetical protein